MLEGACSTLVYGFRGAKTLLQQSVKMKWRVENDSYKLMHDNMNDVENDSYRPRQGNMNDLDWIA